MGETVCLTTQILTPYHFFGVSLFLAFFAGMILAAVICNRRDRAAS
jgi:hypothetical protein